MKSRNRSVLAVLLPLLPAATFLTVDAGATPGQNGRPAAAPPSPLGTRYRLIDLGDGFYATDLNDRGQVVGYVSHRERRTGVLATTYLWEGGKRRQIGKLTGTYGYQHRLNNRAQVTTQLGEDPLRSHRRHFESAALLEGGKVRDLGTLPNLRYSAARDLNDAGTVVGQSGTASGGLGERAALWEPGKRARDLGNLGGEPAEALAVNYQGVVAGWAGLRKGRGRGAFTAHAFLWSRGSMRDLGTLPGHRDSKALGINGRGDVVGVSGVLTGDAVFHAFLWDGTRMQPLPALPGHDQTYVRALNDARQSVGQSYRRRGVEPRTAVLWQEGAVYDLNRLVPPAKGRLLTDGLAVNHRGEILAQGQVGRKLRYFLLRPVPEKTQGKTGPAGRSTVSGVAGPAA